MNEPRALLARVAGSPLLVAETHANDFARGIFAFESAMHTLLPADLLSSDVDSDFWSNPRLAPYRPYSVKDGILTIPVKGALVSEFPYQVFDWITGYEYIEQAALRGLNDAAVRGIVLDISSPGGDAAGNFELAERIAEIAAEKPMVASVGRYAMSGGYSLAAAAGNIVAKPSSLVGSVGVVTMHVDYSGALDKAGIVVTFLYRGENKVDANPYQPLSDAAKAEMEGRINRIYTNFVSSVASNRGMSEEAVRGTEARIYEGDAAVAIGFVDEVKSKDRLESFRSRMEKSKMTTKIEGNDTGAAITAADVAKAVNDAIVADRARTAEVLGCAAYAGRESLAAALLGTSLTAAEIVSALAKAPEPKAKGGFREAMDKIGGAGAGGNLGDDDADDAPKLGAANPLTLAYARAGGKVARDAK